MDKIKSRIFHVLSYKFFDESSDLEIFYGDYKLLQLDGE